MTRHALRLRDVSLALALLPFGWLLLAVAHALTVALVGWLLARPVWMALLFAGVVVWLYAWAYMQKGELS